MKCIRVVTACLAVLLCVCVAGTVIAAEADNSAPTNVTAKTMTYEVDAQRIVFKDDVHVRRLDFELWADTIWVYMKEKPAGAKGQAASGGAPFDAGEVERLVAKGNVRMKQQGKSGESREAIYKVAEGLFVMQGAPVLREGSNVIRGYEIRFYMHENKSEVVGAPDAPVNAVFSTPTRTKQ